MKKMSCDLCDFEVSAETFEEWMSALKPHYVKEHMDFIKNSSRSKEDMINWMAENRERFDRL